MSIDMIVFLGNPGGQYAKNRHNAGRLLAEYVYPSLSWRNKFKGLFASVPVQHGNNTGVQYFLEPETYMNRSGESVAACTSFYKIAPPHILVVHDELELALGQASLKLGGGLGGHNGLRSIKAALNSVDFWRLRIGIGRPAGVKGEADISGWVLSDFSAKETQILEPVLAACGDALAQAATLGPQSLLPLWNKIQLAQKPERG